MNTNLLSKALIFTAGAAIGSVVTWKLLDAKYAQRAEQEIADIKEYYENKYSDDGENAPDELSYEEWAEQNPDKAEEEKKEYLDIVTNYSGEKGGSESMNVGTPPYVIPPEGFDTEEDYDTISLTYYTDGVLADEDDNVIENLANTVGEDFAAHFGEYEDDSVFIRNERLRTDYEILMDYRPFSDIVDTGSNPVDDE